MHYYLCFPTPGPTISDYIIGDGLCYVPLLTTPLPRVPIQLQEQIGICYQVYGKNGSYFNLLTHTCTSVNAHWITVTSSFNIINQIAVRAVSKSLPPVCHTIFVNLEECSVSINGNPPISANGNLFNQGSVVVKRRDNVIEIKVPNCSDQTLVIQVECDDTTNSRVFTCESRRVNITRRLNARNGLVHGILGNT